jgi:hypothetical protein
MKNRQLDILRLLLGISDIVLLNTCLFLAGYLSGKYGLIKQEDLYYNNVLPVNAIWLLCTTFFKLYYEFTVYKSQDIFKATWRSILLFSILFQLNSLLTTSGFQSGFVIIFHIVLIISFTVSRISASFLVTMLKLDVTNRRASILAIASVGGHWVELLRLKPLFQMHDVTFVSNKANLADTVDGSAFHVVPDANRNNIFKLIYCFLSIAGFIVVLRPRVIITTGAAPGLIGILIGRILGIKTIWIDSIANVDELSLSGHIASKFADKVYTQWGHLSTSRISFNGSVL